MGETLDWVGDELRVPISKGVMSANLQVNSIHNFIRPGSLSERRKMQQPYRSLPSSANRVELPYILSACPVVWVGRYGKINTHHGGEANASRH